MDNSDRPLDNLDNTAQHASERIPNFNAVDYQIKKQLGHNKAGGRVTYLATRETQLPVVIKQFQFATVGANWSDYEAHQREIELLQQLDHPSIPRYLDSFQTETGFCLVQEYKNAPSLAHSSHFTPMEVEKIAVAVLKVLVYLQQKNPPVIHRDIKPENILVDEQLNAYLVDFGLARTEGEEMAASSVVKGTLGFMPPEQIFNRQLTTASDLYSVGVTLICLLTKTKSTEVGNLIDEAFRINFKPLLPKLDPQFIKWLERMVEPNLKYRYASAADALAALESINGVCPAATAGKLSPRARKVLLLSFGGVIVLGSSLFISHNYLEPGIISTSPITNSPPTKTDTLRQLLDTRQCSGCNLRGVRLRNADLRSADLTTADLTDADLTQADLRGAFLRNANLKNANLRGANLASTDLKGAIMPDGSIHP